MANLGADFSISAHIGTAPQQPGLIKLWHALCTNVDPFELVYLSDNFTHRWRPSWLLPRPRGLLM